MFGEDNVHYAQGLEYSRDRKTDGFKQARKAARNSDVVLLFIGEEAILSGESHCRADISLPGAQVALINEIAKEGKPIVAVVMAGRPLTFEEVMPHLSAVVYAWHPGTMGGPAIADIISGKENPSGKLPVTFLRHIGQVPMYYNQKNSGKPANDQSWEYMYNIPANAPQRRQATTTEAV